MVITPGTGFTICFIFFSYSNLKKHVENAAASMIAEEPLPLSLVGKPSFRYVMAEATGQRFRPVQAETIRARIIQRAR